MRRDPGPGEFPNPGPTHSPTVLPDVAPRRCAPLSFRSSRGIWASFSKRALRLRPNAQIRTPLTQKRAQLVDGLRRLISAHLDTRSDQISFHRSPCPHGVGQEYFACDLGILLTTRKPGNIDVVSLVPGAVGLDVHRTESTNAKRQRPDSNDFAQVPELRWAKHLGWRYTTGKKIACARCTKAAVERHGTSHVVAVYVVFALALTGRHELGVELCAILIGYLERQYRAPIRRHPEAKA